MGDSGWGGGGSAVMGGGRDACVGSREINERDCCKFPGVIQELWENLRYNLPFFLKFLPNEEGC